MTKQKQTKKEDEEEGEEPYVNIFHSSVTRQSLINRKSWKEAGCGTAKRRHASLRHGGRQDIATPGECWRNTRQALRLLTVWALEGFINYPPPPPPPTAKNPSEDGKENVYIITSHVPPSHTNGIKALRSHSTLWKNIHSLVWPSYLSLQTSPKTTLHFILNVIPSPCKRPHTYSHFTLSLQTSPNLLFTLF